MSQKLDLKQYVSPYFIAKDRTSDEKKRVILKSFEHMLDRLEKEDFEFGTMIVEMGPYRVDKNGPDYFKIEIRGRRKADDSEENPVRISDV